MRTFRATINSLPQNIIVIVITLECKGLKGIRIYTISICTIQIRPTNNRTFCSIYEAAIIDKTILSANALLLSMAAYIDSIAKLLYLFQHIKLKPHDSDNKSCHVRIFIHKFSNKTHVTLQLLAHWLS